MLGRSAQPPVSRLATAFAAGLLLATLAACHISRPAEPGRRATASLPGPDAWPERDLDAVRGFHERTPEVFHYWERNGLVADERISPADRKRLETPDQTVVANRLTELGLLRVWRETDPPTGAFEFRFGERFLPNATFLTSREATGYRLETALEDVPEVLGAPRGETNFFRPGLQRTFADRAVLMHRGIDMHIPETPRGKGLLVVMGGLFSTTWEESSVALFHKAGWDILQVEATTAVRRPNEDAYVRVLDERSDWVIAEIKARSGLVDENGAALVPDDASMARFDRNTTYEAMKSISDEAAQKFPLPASGFELTDTTDPGELGRTIARAVDDTLAETAYAAAAAVGYLVDAHGRDALGPIGVVGYSAGSFAAPAVAARLIEEGHPVDAIILLGAGADLFEITQTSNITDGGIDLTGKGKHSPAAERIEAVHDAYLEHTRLDPYALGPALADIPALLMIADRDKPVPTGELLDERFGRPRRIRYFGGHAGLFYFLPPQTPSMIRWLDEVTQGDD